MTDAGIDRVAVRAGRDRLGRACHLLHIAVMIFIVCGWLMPARAALIFYLAFLPAIVLQWQFNRNSCVLNNLESLVRSGSWRDRGNSEEGAWLLALARNTLGLRVRPAQLDAVVYVALAALWATGLVHWFRA
ncbi:MAG: hypothetical protein ACREHV_13510 [Rhizomicrobium sp.]